MDDYLAKLARTDHRTSPSKDSVPIGMREAGALGIKSLYHYQPYFLKWLEQTINNNVL